MQVDIFTQMYFQKAIAKVLDVFTLSILSVLIAQVDISLRRNPQKAIAKTLHDVLQHSVGHPRPRPPESRSGVLRRRFSTRRLPPGQPQGQENPETAERGVATSSGVHREPFAHDGLRGRRRVELAAQD